MGVLIIKADCCARLRADAGSIQAAKYGTKIAVKKFIFATAGEKRKGKIHVRIRSCGIILVKIL
jgi:hypothetical protein